MADSYRKTRLKDSSFRRLVLIAVLGFILLVLLLRQNTIVALIPIYSPDEKNPTALPNNHTLALNNFNLLKQNELSISLRIRNRMPPRNTDLYPNLAKDHIVIVLYVHNRPQYLQVAINGLSQVEGINETLLIVSHDGYFKEMNKIVESIDFCQVKQIFAPYSPHIFPNSFPGSSPSDCNDKDELTKTDHCVGTKDQYGNYRSPKIVSLKHHWWWMMNTVWDGLRETRFRTGHIVFIEEDHFVYPNAYRNLQMLVKLKPEKCPNCYAVNLAPSDVLSRGEGWDVLVVEKIGNVGYAFNRMVWRKIHERAKEFCTFDEYNWDITMWAVVYPSFGGSAYTLRGPRASAVHFGKCGLHQGQSGKEACVGDGILTFELNEIDRVANIRSEWGVHVRDKQEGYQAGFKGWGGWGDVRDHRLCLDFAEMYMPFR